MLSNISELIKFYYSDDEFSSAVFHTAEHSGFSVDLIEKDYLCSLILMYIYLNRSCPIVFKGGTLLAKVYTDFYRLSEDLDFTLPMIETATRKQRSNKIQPLKKIFSSITKDLPIFKVSKPLTGSNQSRQYNMELNYKSKVSPRRGRLLIEIGLREQLLESIMVNEAKTLLLDPYSETQKVNLIKLRTLSSLEAYAEKTRAALCRQKLAIRDFYDLDYAMVNNIINMNDKTFIKLVKEKISCEQYIHNLMDSKIISYLHDKVESELKPTLRYLSIDMFDLKRVIKKLINLTQSLNYEN